MHKNYKTLTLLAIISIIVVALTACQTAATEEVETSETIQVTVSIVPMSYFVERIAGDHVAVNIMVVPGESPHSYEPTSDQMTALADSEVFFSIGVDYEATWLPRFEEINPDLPFVDVSEGIERIAMNSSSEGENLDPHVWMSPANGKVIAANIAATLSELDPDNAETYQANADELYADIDQLDADIQDILSGITQTSFMVFHPAFGYFANDYGLEQIAIEIEGSEPSASELADLVDTALEEGIKVIFVQPSFSTEDAEAIAQEIGGEIAFISPLAEDWLSNMRTVAEAFAATLSE